MSFFAALKQYATVENINQAVTFIQSTGILQTSTSDKTNARSEITTPNYSELHKLPDADLKEVHFVVYEKPSAKSYHLVFEDIQKQLFVTQSKGEAVYLSRGLETLHNLANEAFDQKSLEKLVDLVIDHQHWSGFHYACATGCAAYLSMMLRSDESILTTPTPDTGETPLTISLRFNHVEIAEFIIKLGVSPLSPDSNGSTAFHAAAAHSPAGLKMLLYEEYNAANGILQLDKKGCVPLQVAINAENFDSVDLLARFMKLEDFREIALRGCKPLHDPANPKFKKRVAEIILTHNRDCAELRYEDKTPLMANIIRGDSEMVLVMIAYYASVDVTDKNGLSPLLLAIREGQITIIQLLLGLGLPLDMDAAKNAMSTLNMIKRRSIEEVLSHIRPQPTPATNAKTTKPKNVLDHCQNRLITAAKTIPEADFARRCNILSLDGGGIRGIATISILLSLETVLAKHYGKQVRLNDAFDWYAGTSTGGILALALSEGSRSVFDVLRLYLRFRDKVFCGNRPYDSARLEKALKDELGDAQLGRDASKKRVVVTATKGNVVPPELHMFRSYPMEDERDFREMKQWFAARCTSAAPTYFSSPDNVYLDGGLMANNPTSDVLTDFMKLNEIAMANNKPPLSLGCVVSVGTGRPPPKDIPVTNISFPKGFTDVLQNGYSQFSSIMSLSKMFIDQICASDGPVAQRAQALAHANGAPLFRLTPPLHRDIDLDAADDTSVIELLWTARCYVESQAMNDIENIVALLIPRVKQVEASKN
uniref:phospholipase A2 n=1 Tax=Panagrellus redivivus TaxID=6233 RepID=A0A7E4VFJ5_PANRE